jgi:hypothetical protein
LFDAGFFEELKRTQVYEFITVEINVILENCVTVFWCKSWNEVNKYLFLSEILHFIVVFFETFWIKVLANKLMRDPQILNVGIVGILVYHTCGGVGISSGCSNIALVDHKIEVLTNSERER